MKASLVSRLRKATTSTYTFTDVIPGEQVTITKILLPQVMMKWPELLTELLPDSAGDSSPAMSARQRALQATQPPTSGSPSMTEDKLNTWVKLIISVIDAGCPEFAGRIYLSPEEFPPTPPGEEEPERFVYAQLGLDFFGLFKAIMELSGLGGEQAEPVKSFPENQAGTPVESPPDGQ